MDGAAIDIDIYRSSTGYSLVTVGLGLVRQPGGGRVELSMALPATWQPGSVDEAAYYWPFGWMRWVARIGQDSPMPLLEGDLLEVPTNPEGPRPTNFAGVVLVEASRFGIVVSDAPSFGEIPVTLLHMCPVFASEVGLARRSGQDRNDGTALANQLLDSGLPFWCANIWRAPLV